MSAPPLWTPVIHCYSSVCTATVCCVPNLAAEVVLELCIFYSIGTRTSLSCLLFVQLRKRIIVCEIARLTFGHVSPFFTGLELSGSTEGNSVRVSCTPVFLGCLALRCLQWQRSLRVPGHSCAASLCFALLRFASLRWRFFGLRQSYDFDLLVFGLGLRSRTVDDDFSVDFFALVDDFALTVDYDRTFSRRSL